MPMQALKPQVQPVGASGSQPNIYSAGRQNVPESRPDTQVLDAVGQLGRGLGQFAGVIADAEVKQAEEQEVLETIETTNKYSARLNEAKFNIFASLKGKDAVGLTKKAQEFSKEALDDTVGTIQNPRVKAAVLARSLAEQSTLLDWAAGREAEQREAYKKQTLDGDLATSEAAVRDAASGGDYVAFQPIVARTVENYIALHPGEENTAAVLAIKKGLAKAYMLGLPPAIVSKQSKFFEGIIDKEDLTKIVENSEVEGKKQRLDNAYSVASKMKTYEEMEAYIKSDTSGLEGTEQSAVLDMLYGDITKSMALQKKAADELSDDVQVEVSEDHLNGTLTEGKLKEYKKKGLSDDAIVVWRRILKDETEQKAREAKADRQRRESEALAAQRHAQQMARMSAQDARIAATEARQAQDRAKDDAADKAMKELSDAAASGKPYPALLSKYKDVLPANVYAAHRATVNVDAIAFSRLYARIAAGEAVPAGEISKYTDKGISAAQNAELQKFSQSVRKGTIAVADKSARDKGLALIKTTFENPQQQANMMMTFAMATKGLHGAEIYDVAYSYCATKPVSWGRDIQGAAGKFSAGVLGYDGKQRTLQQIWNDPENIPYIREAMPIVQKRNPRLKGEALQRKTLEFLAIPANVQALDRKRGR